MWSFHLYVQQCPVHLAFNRYRPTCTKNATEFNRAGNNASHKHLLTFINASTSTDSTPECHTQQNSIHQLDNGISGGTPECQYQWAGHNTEHSVTQPMSTGDISRRPDLQSLHEEADVIVNQLVKLAATGASNIRVVCDDTDVFILPDLFLPQREAVMWCHWCGDGESCRWSSCHRYKRHCQLNTWTLQILFLVPMPLMVVIPHNTLLASGRLRQWNLCTAGGNWSC